MSSYEIKIQQFEGPMDLLLYLVQKNELNPMEISITAICDQFVEYIKDLEKTDLGRAGEFLFMAAHLMSLKARELLPKEEQGEKELLEFDEEREELIRRMLEYKQYKEAADTFKDLEEENFGTYSRGRVESTGREEKKDDELDFQVFDLYEAFLNTLKTKNLQSVHTIEVDYVTIEDRQQWINNFLLDNGRASFEELLGRDIHPVMIAVTFMAILEMVKLDNIVIRQSSLDSILRVYRKNENPDHIVEMSYDHRDYSEDPNFVKGLVEEIQNRKPVDDSKDLDVILKEVSEKVNEGHHYNDDDLDAIIEGRRSSMPSFEEVKNQQVEKYFASFTQKKDETSEVPSYVDRLDFSKLHWFIKEKPFLADDKKPTLNKEQRWFKKPNGSSRWFSS